MVEILTDLNSKWKWGSENTPPFLSESHAFPALWYPFFLLSLVFMGKMENQKSSRSVEFILSLWSRKQSR